MSERQNIEWKESWHDDYLKWVCGFANAFGGVIYIGKDNDGNVVHLRNYKTLLEQIPQKIRNTMGIICDINLKEEKSKKFLEIKVNPYSVPVSLRGRYYYRSGSTKMELVGVELNEFLLKKVGKTWDDIVEVGASIDDINDASIKKFIEDSKEQGRLPDTTGLTSLQVLNKLGLVEDGKLKRAALILFGKDPGRFFPNILVKIGRFGKDGSDLKFHEVIEGNLIHLLYEVQVQLNYKFLTRSVSFSGMQRIEKRAYPTDALREMLLNALVHRTYMGAPIQIRVYDHKLSIWNEGMLPHGVDIESLKADHNSRPRNPKIADACFKASYIDAWGRGTIKIINSCEEAELPEPDIIEKDGGVEVTVFKNRVYDVRASLNRVDDDGQVDEYGGQVGDQVAEVGGQVDEYGGQVGEYGGQVDDDGGQVDEYGGQVGDQVDDDGGQVGGQADEYGGQVGDLTSRQKEVLGLIIDNPEISRKELAEKLGINHSAVQKHTDALKRKKVIEREGKTTGQWIVKG